MGLAQIGEFAYIIAAMGITLRITDDYLYQVAVAVSLLTTVINPYILRLADPLAAGLKRLTSMRLREGVNLYQNWLARIGEARRNNAVALVVRRSIWIVLINAALIAAIFLIGAFLSTRKAELFPDLHLWRNTVNVLLWSLAAMIALPLYVSSIRKLQALGMILSEICVPADLDAGWARNLRSLIANVFLLVGMLALGVMSFVVSSALLPSWYEQVVLLAVMTLFMWFRWRKLIAVYARAQTTLLELFAHETQRASAPVVQSLVSVHMETVTVSPQSVAAGRRIGSVKLRNRTGANIVSLERDGQTQVNPGPGEMLHPGDRLLLLGDHEQIERALLLLR
ncbi:MAG: TrkA C-terminal domain-containing protein [Lentisphaerota bacterium]